MEIAVAACSSSLAVVVMIDSHRLGMGWVDDGPEAGYFPFYVGLIMFISAARCSICQAVGRRTPAEDLRRDAGSARLVMAVLIPTIVYVVGDRLLGIYVASAMFIAFFMTWHGKYPVLKSAPVGVVVVSRLLLMFEVWFLVPLPKGPLEALLGY